MVRRELGLVKRKKGALDGLFDAGKISQPTYDNLIKGLTEAMARIEADQKTLAERMTSRANELEKQSQTLEMFLANLEIQYAAAEIDEEVYEDQGNAIALGLEVTKRELADIKEALIQLTPVEAAPKAEEITIKGMIQKIRVLEEMVMEAAKKRAELEAKVKALEEERACLLAEIEALKAIPELEAKIPALESEIATLKEEKKALEEKAAPPPPPPVEVAPCEAAPPEAVPAEAPAPAEEKPSEEKPCE